MSIADDLRIAADEIQFLAETFTAGYRRQNLSQKAERLRAHAVTIERVIKRMHELSPSMQTVKACEELISLAYELENSE